MDLDQNTNTMSTGSNSPSACVCADATRMVSVGGQCFCRAGFFNPHPGECHICSFGSYTEEDNNAQSCTQCSATDPFTNTTSKGSRSQDDCICTDEFHEKVPDEPEWDADLVGKCACKLGYFWDNTIDACTHCAADFYRATYLIPVATSDGAGGFTFGSQDSCSACSAFDSNSITNGTTAASSTESCVCRDANMEKVRMGASRSGRPSLFFFALLNKLLTKPDRLPFIAADGRRWKVWMQARVLL